MARSGAVISQPHVGQRRRAGNLFENPYLVRIDLLVLYVVSIEDDPARAIATDAPRRITGAATSGPSVPRFGVEYESLPVGTV